MMAQVQAGLRPHHHGEPAGVFTIDNAYAMFESLRVGLWHAWPVRESPVGQPACLVTWGPARMAGGSHVYGLELLSQCRDQPTGAPVAEEEITGRAGLLAGRHHTNGMSLFVRCE